MVENHCSSCIRTYLTKVEKRAFVVLIFFLFEYFYFLTCWKQIIWWKDWWVLRWHSLVLIIGNLTLLSFLHFLSNSKEDLISVELGWTNLLNHWNQLLLLFNLWKPQNWVTRTTLCHPKVMFKQCILASFKF